MLRWSRVRNLFRRDLNDDLDAELQSHLDQAHADWAGVTAYAVEQQTREIGVRMALGATRSSVVAMVLRGALGHIGIGVALGIPAAIGAGLLMANQLFGVKAWDPMMLCAAPLLLTVASLIAAAVPARRAATVDPVQALKAE